MVGVERVAHRLALESGAVGKPQLRCGKRLTSGATPALVGDVDPVEDVLVGVVVGVGLGVEAVPGGVRWHRGSKHRDRVVPLAQIAAVALDERVGRALIRARPVVRDRVRGGPVVDVRGQRLEAGMGEFAVQNHRGTGWRRELGAPVGDLLAGEALVRTRVDVGERPGPEAAGCGQVVRVVTGGNRSLRDRHRDQRGDGQHRRNREGPERSPAHLRASAATAPLTVAASVPPTSSTTRSRDRPSPSAVSTTVSA